MAPPSHALLGVAPEPALTTLYLPQIPIRGTGSVSFVSFNHLRTPFAPPRLSGKSAATSDCIDGMFVSGSNNHPTINGCFKHRSQGVNGFPSYLNKHWKLLYWQPDHNGQWVISDALGSGFRAFATSTGAAGPAGTKEWHTLKLIGKVSWTWQCCCWGRVNSVIANGSVTGGARQSMRVCSLTLDPRP